MQHTQEDTSTQVMSVKPALKTGSTKRKRELEEALGRKKYELIGHLVENGFCMTNDIISRLDSTTNFGVEKSLIEILKEQVVHMEGATTLIQQFSEIASEIEAEERK